MIAIKNHKIEKMIDEILKRSTFCDPIQYLEFRVKSDYEAIKRNKKLN